MSDFSQSPDDLLRISRDRGYVGLHVEQGVPVLDRDLNLMHDLLAAGVRSLFANFFGDGAAADTDAFRIAPIAPAGPDLLITGPGSLLVDGIEVPIGASQPYSSQPGAPALTTPAAPDPDPRIDTAYLEAWLSEVDESADTDLANAADIGMQTSVRLRTTWMVRVAEGGPVPAPVPGHVQYPLARISRPLGNATITAAMITDLRQGRLTVSALARRLALIERVLLLPSFVPDASPIPQFAPQTGVVNQPVQINGANFDVGTLAVLFGGVQAQIVGTPSATQVVARVPGGLTPDGAATPVRLTLRNQGGQVVSDDIFVVQATPSITAFTPKLGTPGTSVTITGFNLNVGSAPKVLFGTVQADLVGTSTATSITAKVPAGLVPTGATSTDVKITVQNAAGSDLSDDTFRAELDIPAPAFSASPQFTPQTGTPTQIVTLTGLNFNFPPVSVRFDTVTAIINGAPSATQLVVAVPAGITPPGTPRAVSITVTTGGGSVTSTDKFVAR